MNDLTSPNAAEKLKTWVKKEVEKATHKLMDQRNYTSPTIESKPAWVLPYTLVIGKIREGGQNLEFEWFICGDANLSKVHSSIADSPREAARHFALQWQLEAARQGESGADLAKRAEALYELVEDAALWQGSSDNDPTS